MLSQSREIRIFNRINAGLEEHILLYFFWGGGGGGGGGGVTSTLASGI